MHIKHEMGVFLKNIVLSVLDSTNAGFAHKMMALALLARIADDPATLVEIYLNYDCDLQATDLFARLVQQLCRLAQGCKAHAVADGGWASPAEESELRQSALGCIVSVVRSLSTWSLSVQPRAEPEGAHEEAGHAGEPEENGLGVGVGGDDTFLALKQRKMGLEEAVYRFNLEYKKGLAYLRQHKLLGDGDEVSKSLSPQS